MASFESGFEKIECLSTSNELLMSLFEETLMEDHEGEEDEQLNRVMRWFEAEINPGVKDGVSGHVDEEGCLRSQDYDLDLKWIDGEMPADDLVSCWRMESGVDEMDGVEFGGFDGVEFGGFPLEEHFYSSLLQDNKDFVMYN